MTLNKIKEDMTAAATQSKDNFVVMSLVQKHLENQIKSNQTRLKYNKKEDQQKLSSNKTRELKHFHFDKEFKSVIRLNLPSISHKEKLSFITFENG